MNSARLYRVILKIEPEGAYTVSIPSLPGCISWSGNIEHALEMIKEAAERYIAVLKEAGEIISNDNETLSYNLVLNG